YLPNDKGDYGEGTKVPADVLNRTGYRLATAEEWEYACRAGSATAWSMGDAEELLPRYAWCARNAADKTYPVGLLRPNDWGLFDLHGNVSEWCQNDLSDKDDNNRKEHMIRNTDARWVRGGAFGFHAAVARSANRNSVPPEFRLDVGFRPVRTFP